MLTVTQPQMESYFIFFRRPLTTGAKANIVTIT